MADDRRRPREPATGRATAGDGVTRSVDLDAGADEVWRAVTDPDERALWLDDPDAASRRVRVDEAAPGRAPRVDVVAPGRRGRRLAP